jgi:hypothetical protein
MRVEIAEDREARGTGALQLQVWDPWPNVPYWMQIDLEPGSHPFWTLPSGHAFERMPGETGFAGHLQRIARRYAAGEADRTTAELQLAETLAQWSRATTWSEGTG